MMLTGLDQLWVADVTYIRPKTESRPTGGGSGCFLMMGDRLGAKPNLGK